MTRQLDAAANIWQDQSDGWIIESSCELPLSHRMNLHDAFKKQYTGTLDGSE